MVDFNESEGESAFLVVRSTKGVWFDNPHVFHRSLAKVPISFCFAEGAQVQTELGPTASVKVGGYFASSADYEEWYQRRRASLTLPPSLGAEVRTFTPGSALSLRCPRLQTVTFLLGAATPTGPLSAKEFPVEMEPVPAASAWHLRRASSADHD